MKCWQVVILILATLAAVTVAALGILDAILGSLADTLL